MAQYTTPHSLPVIEPTVDRIKDLSVPAALAKDINALSAATNVAISAEGGRAEEAAKAHADTLVTADRSRLAAIEVGDASRDARIESTRIETRLFATAQGLTAQDYADQKVAALQSAIETSHIALDADGTPYFRPGSTTVKILQDSDGTPYYEVA